MPIRLCITAFVLCVAASPQVAQPQVSVPGDLARLDARTVFAIGNIEYILLHELAHLVIREFDIPILGPEESAADYIATIVLINAHRFDAGTTTRAHRYLLSTANGLATSWEVFERGEESAKYWDNHALTIQRFYNVVCLMYGSDIEEFRDLPAAVGMPMSRARRCQDEYERAIRSVDWLLANYGRKPDDRSAQNTPLVVRAAGTRTAQRVMAAITETGILENTLRLFDQQFVVPTGFEVVFRSCGQAQAEWLPQTRELVFCYELVDFYYSLGGTRAAAARRSLLGD